MALDGGNGTLNLNGVPTTLTTFTAAQFVQLTYTAGDQGTQQNLVVIAQTGTLQANGSLTGEIDSPAVQITADVTGSRSINAMNALVNTPTTTADANVAAIVQQAGIFTGFGGAARPTLQTVLTPDPPLPLTTAGQDAGAYDIAGLSEAATLIDLAALYPGAIGGSNSPGVMAAPGGSVAAALLLLDGDATGSFQTADDPAAQAVAIKAYNTTEAL